MKVALRVTIEVDPAEWVAEYGCERDRVREDVRDYFTGQVTQAVASDVTMAVTVR